MIMLNLINFLDIRFTRVSARNCYTYFIASPTKSTAKITYLWLYECLVLLSLYKFIDKLQLNTIDYLMDKETCLFYMFS